MKYFGTQNYIFHFDYVLTDENYVLTLIPSPLPFKLRVCTNIIISDRHLQITTQSQPAQPTTTTASHSSPVAGWLVLQ
jgi:hypothetical protein